VRVLGERSLLLNSLGKRESNLRIVELLNLWSPTFRCQNLLHSDDLKNKRVKCLSYEEGFF